MGFFDFLGAVSAKKYDNNMLNRLNVRHDFFIKSIEDRIKGARVLDLAAHDGRWSYAFAAAGASEVLAIEGRAQTTKQYRHYPASPFKNKVRFETGDVFEKMRELAIRGEQFDIIGMLGIYYHIMDHFMLLKLAHAFQPKLIVVDSGFVTEKRSIIMLTKENTSNDLASIPQVEGQITAVVGIPSLMAMEDMAGALGYDVRWLDWNTVPSDQRLGLDHYYSAGRRRRGTCILEPREALGEMAARDGVHAEVE